MVTGFAFVVLGSLFLQMLHLTKSGLWLFLLKMLSRYLVSLVKPSVESQTSCVHLVKVCMVVAFWEVGLYDDWSRNLLV